MTEARFWEREGCRCLEVTGHAGFDQSGRDIVCAACSIIVQALAAALEAEPGVNASYGMDAGRFWLVCGAAGRSAARRDAMFTMAHTAFRMLEGTYPEHVHLIDDIDQSMIK